LIAFLGTFDPACSQSKNKQAALKIVFIRHGEKADDGDNLSCKGLNRSYLLPALIKAKFGVPDYIYVPALNLGKSTKHSRMFQTITPMAVKYNLSLNSTYDTDDASDLADNLEKKNGTVLVVWEHEAIAGIVKALGIKGISKWPDEDYDSIWIITFPKGVATLTRDKEGLNPTSDCKF
jgi:hypothetical protein